VDSGESSEEEFSLFIHGTSVRELGRIGRLGVSGRRSAAIAAPYQPGNVRLPTLLLRKFAVPLDEPCAITGDPVMYHGSQSWPLVRGSTRVSRDRAFRPHGG